MAVELINNHVISVLIKRKVDKSDLLDTVGPLESLWVVEGSSTAFNSNIRNLLNCLLKENLRVVLTQCKSPGKMKTLLIRAAKNRVKSYADRQLFSDLVILERRM